MPDLFTTLLFPEAEDRFPFSVSPNKKIKSSLTTTTSVTVPSPLYLMVRQNDFKSLVNIPLKSLVSEISFLSHHHLKFINEMARISLHFS